MSTPRAGKCRTCPWRPENADRVYVLWNEIPTRGALFGERWAGPHYCHESLDADGMITLDSYPCVGTPKEVVARDPDGGDEPCARV